MNNSFIIEFPDDVKGTVVKGIDLGDLIRPEDCPRLFGTSAMNFAARARQLVGFPATIFEPVYGRRAYTLTSLKEYAKLYHATRNKMLFSDARLAEMSDAEKEEWGLIAGLHFKKTETK